MFDYIKLFFVFVLRMLSRLFYIFPIKKNRIMFYSFAGKNYSCNPAVISDYLINNYSDKFDIIWQFQEPQKYQYLIQKGIRVVGQKQISAIYYYLTSNVLVDNAGPHPFVRTRKNQLVINTWHGGGCYKKVSLSDKNNNWAMDKKFQLSYSNVNLFLSSSSFFTKNVIRKSFGYKGEVLECGMPRNDILLCSQENEAREKEIRQKIGLVEHQKLLLYAPTWRRDKSTEQYQLDFDGLKDALNKRFGFEWVVGVRFHYELKKVNIGDDKVINLSDYPDMQELLLVSDVLISDYSSSIWDYSFTYRPTFLYTPDLEYYLSDRGFEKDIFSWGFPVCQNYAQLVDQIIKFDQEDYTSKMIRHHEELKSCETGSATEIVCQLIYDKCIKD